MTKQKVGEGKHGSPIWFHDKVILVIIALIYHKGGALMTLLAFKGPISQFPQSGS
jgi:hypothetical protein